MAKKLINRLTRSQNQQNSKVEPDVLRNYSVGAFLTDEENRTLWVNGMPYGNAYISTATRQPKHAEVFNDFTHNKAEGHYSHVEGGTYVNTVYNNTRITYHETPTNGYKYSVPYTSVLNKMISVMARQDMNIPLYVAINNEGRLDPTNRENYVDSNNRIANDAYTPTGVNVNIDSTELSDDVSESTYNTPSQTKYYIVNSNTISGNIYFNVATSFTSATMAELPTYCNGKTMYFHYYYAYDGKDGWSEATKDGAHAEGISQAHGVMSHSEGFANRSYEDYSHSEGVGNEVYGLAAHAEGDRNIVTNSAPYSHAEGHMNVVKGDSGHAEGRNNLVDATGAHAEGGNNIVKGMYAHVEGQKTTAYGTGAHAEGVGTKTSNNGEHAEGRYNVSSNNYISSIGIGTETARKNAVTVLDDGRVFLASTSEEINNVYNDYNPCLYTGFKLSNNSKSLQNILANIEERMQNVTYAELKNLRDNYALTPGKFYRIIDFVTTVKMDLEEIKSAGHAFDIIVLALNNNILSENAYAMPKSENGYDLKAILYVGMVEDENEEDENGNPKLVQKNIILGNSSDESYNLYTYTVSNGIYCNTVNKIDLSEYTWEEVDASKVIIDINNATPFSNYYELDISKVLTLKNEDGSKCFIYDYSSLKNKLNTETNTDIDNFNRYRFKRCTIDNSGSIKSIESFIDEYIFPEIIDIVNNEPVFLSEEYIKNAEYYYNDKYNSSAAPYNLHAWKLKYNVDGFQNIQNIGENYTYPEYLQFNAYDATALPNISGTAAVNSSATPVINTLTYYTKTNLNKDTITSNNNPNLWPIAGFENKELFKDFAYRWNIVNINGTELKDDAFKDLCILTNFIEPASESDTRFKAALCKQDKVSIINEETSTYSYTISNYNNLAFLNTKTDTSQTSANVIKTYSNIYNCYNIGTPDGYKNEFGETINNGTNKFVVSDCIYIQETRSFSTQSDDEPTSGETPAAMTVSNESYVGSVKIPVGIPAQSFGTLNNYNGTNYVKDHIKRLNGTNVKTENLQCLKINPENSTEVIDNNSNYYVITNSAINNDNDNDKLELSDAQIYYAPSSTTSSVVQLTKKDSENAGGFVEFIYGKNINFVNKIVYKYEETITEGSNTITSIKDAHFYIKTDSSSNNPIKFNNENIKNFIAEKYLNNPVNVTDESEPSVETNNNIYYIYELLYIVENDKYIIVTPDVLNEKGISNQESSTKIIKAFEDKDIDIKFFGSKYIIASFNGNDINMLDNTLYDAYIVDRDLPLETVFDGNGKEYITSSNVSNIFAIKSEYDLNNEKIYINTDKTNTNKYTMYGALFNAKEITLNNTATTYNLQHSKLEYNITVGSTNYTMCNFDLSNYIIKYQDVSYSSYLAGGNTNTNAIIFSVNSDYNPFYDILTAFNNVISGSCIGICKFITSSQTEQYLYYKNPNEINGQDNTTESAVFNYQPEINKYDYLELLSYIGSETSNAETFNYASSFISHYIPYYFSRGFIYEFVDEYNNYFQYDPTNIMYYYDTNWYYTFDKNGKDYLRNGTIRNNRFLYNGSKKEYEGVLIKNIFTVTGDVLLACLNNTFNNSSNITFEINKETSILNNTFNDIYNTSFTCELIKDSIFSNFYNKTIDGNQENVILNSLFTSEYSSTNNVIKPLFSLGNFRVFNNNATTIQTADNIYNTQFTIDTTCDKNAECTVDSNYTETTPWKLYDHSGGDYESNDEWNYVYNESQISINININPPLDSSNKVIDNAIPLILGKYIDIGYIYGYLSFRYNWHRYSGAKYAPDWKVKFNPKLNITGAITSNGYINIGYTNDSIESDMSEKTTYRRIPVSRIAIDITKCSTTTSSRIIEYNGSKYLHIASPVIINIIFDKNTYYSGAQNDTKTTGANPQIGAITFTLTRPKFADELDRNETAMFNPSDYSTYEKTVHEFINNSKTFNIKGYTYSSGSSDSLIAVCVDGLLIKNSNNNYILSKPYKLSDKGWQMKTEYNGSDDYNIIISSDSGLQ